MRRGLFVAFGGAALGIACVAAPVAAQSVPERLDDLRLATAVRLALVADPVTRPLDVGVVARRGDVVLTSEAGGRAREIVRVARAVPGVRSVGGLGVDAPADASVTISERSPPDRRPSEPSPPASDGPVYHTVQRGETLFSLARRYETTLDAILALNDRQSTAIRVGERLRVR